MRGLVLVALVAACGGREAPATLSSRADPPRPSAVADQDGDEIVDAKDGCPTKPEDFDLRADTDGCPDLDDDRDGVPDATDTCFDTPGLAALHGCPDEDCVFITDITDCWLSPIAFDQSPPRAFDHVVAVIEKYPEIREVTLQTQQTLAQPAGTARARLERVKKELVARGVPADLLVLKESEPADPGEKPRSDVFGLVTKQRFEDGKFRETVCADELGPVRRVARAKNYSCKPSVCGNGRCGVHEDVTNCPQDCP
ncbi:MAG TPA: hypothetical protein VMZ53_18245 [Kofleriaceae bacterium]|nr:hypothetical protein [Kofleriaceae bacterium]